MLENYVKLIREGKMSIKFPKDYNLDMVEKVLTTIWPEDTEWLKDTAPMSTGVEGVYGVTDSIWATTNSSGKFIRSYPLQMLYMEILTNDTVLDFIDKCHQEIIYEPQCMHFHQILKLKFPNAKPYYDNSHVITEIGGNYYDWDGLTERGRHIPFDMYGDNWIFEHYRATVNKIKNTYEYSETEEGDRSSTQSDKEETEHLHLPNYKGDRDQRKTHKIDRRGRKKLYFRHLV